MPQFLGSLEWTKLVEIGAVGAPRRNGPRRRFLTPRRPYERFPDSVSRFTFERFTTFERALTVEAPAQPSHCADILVHGAYREKSNHEKNTAPNRSHNNSTEHHRQRYPCVRDPHPEASLLTCGTYASATRISRTLPLKQHKPSLGEATQAPQS